MLAFNMDDSADRRRDVVFSVAGFIADTENWFDIERYWMRRLEREGLSYFRTYDCRNLTGEFQLKLVDRYGLTTARVIADAVYNDLKQILATSEIYAYCFGVLMNDYRIVCKEPDGEIVLNEDPYIFAHQMLIGLVLDDVHKFPRREIVAFVYDEHGKAALLHGAWAGYKECNPNWARSAGTLAPADDKITPAIQMADLLAHHTTQLFLERRNNSREAERILKDWLKSHVMHVAYADAEFLRLLVAENVGRIRAMESRVKHGLIVPNPVMASTG